MKSIRWALGLMGASVVLAWGCAGGGGAFVPEFKDDSPCHPTVNLVMAAETNQVTLQPGGNRDVEIRVRDLNAPRPDQPKNGNTVGLQVQGTLPDGLTAEVFPTSVHPTYEGVLSLLMIGAYSNTPPGTYDIAVVGTIGSCIKSVPIRIIVQAPSTQPFNITPNFSAVSVPQGGSIDLDFTVRTTLAASPGSRVPFSYNLVCPAEFRYAMSVTPIDITPTSGGVVITLHLNVGTLTPTGMYNLELWGNDGSHSDDAPFMLLVTSEPV